MIYTLHVTAARDYAPLLSQDSPHAAVAADDISSAPRTDIAFYAMLDDAYYAAVATYMW